MTRPPLALPPSGLPFLPMLPRRRPTTLRACGVFARRSLPVVPSSPLAVWAGCPSLLRSVRLWITGTNVVEWNSRRVTRSTVPRFEVQVVMITPGQLRQSALRSIEHDHRDHPSKVVVPSPIVDQYRSKDRDVPEVVSRKVSSVYAKAEKNWLAMSKRMNPPPSQLMRKSLLLCPTLFLGESVIGREVAGVAVVFVARVAG
ncbi:hypothetical protein L1987_88955 [Smallanthus sonchifolius]|nr:hypothetical protein L1987_88955 [Smallanthus sonchifolius]